jgi:hypothetical protein
MQILTDNQGNISLIKNPVHHNRLKHIDICHHYVSTCEVRFEYCSTNEISANLLTKGNPRSKHHHECMERIGLR